jgi:hypothetical protein
MVSTQNPERAKIGVNRSRLRRALKTLSAKGKNPVHVMAKMAGSRVRFHAANGCLIPMIPKIEAQSVREVAM